MKFLVFCRYEDAPSSITDTGIVKHTWKTQIEKLLGCLSKFLQDDKEDRLGWSEM